MSDRHPIWAVIDEMEDDITDVERFADLLGHLASSPHSIEPATLQVVASPLLAIGMRLQEKFKVVHKMGGEL